jgi:hypothetical protein
MSSLENQISSSRLSTIHTWFVSETVLANLAPCNTTNTNKADFVGVGNFAVAVVGGGGTAAAVVVVCVVVVVAVVAVAAACCAGLLCYCCL